jgi:hypothetical protein
MAMVDPQDLVIESDEENNEKLIHALVPVHRGFLPLMVEGQYSCGPGRPVQAVSGGASPAISCAP